ncbi:MAG: magnesium/cobalt transporter CorA [Pseudomonadota bacterium]
MLRGYRCVAGRLERVETLPPDLRGLVWLDLVDPDREEERLVEQALGIDVPTREEMAEIEITSRLYHEDGAAFMTALLPAHTEGERPIAAPVTFVLAGDRLVTIRMHEPRAFRLFPSRVERLEVDCTDGERVLFGLLEAIVDRLADILETAGVDIDALSARVFHQPEGPPMPTEALRETVRALGRDGDLLAKLHASLANLERLLGFLGQVTQQRDTPKETRARLKPLQRDVHSLMEHVAFLDQKIAFLLDATLGLVNIEQNAIIKIVSVAAVVFLPPTVVASIYGMNFDHMPELHWALGYPFALVLMVASAVLPYWLFRRKGWL